MNINEIYLKNLINKCVNEEIESYKEHIKQGISKGPLTAFRHGQELAADFKNKLSNFGYSENGSNNNSSNSNVSGDVQKPIQALTDLMNKGVLGKKMGNKFIEYLKKYGNK